MPPHPVATRAVLVLACLIGTCLIGAGPCVAQTAPHDSTVGQGVRSFVETIGTPAVPDSTVADSLRALVNLVVQQSVFPTAACDVDIRDGFAAYRDSADAVYALDAFGNVLEAYGRPAEGDSLLLVVGGPAALIDRIRVRLDSPPRTPGPAPLTGGPAPAVGIKDTAAPSCRVRRFVLADVAPGVVDVRLDAMGLNAKREIVSSEIGALKVGVERRYSGMLTFGPVYTGLADPTFTLVPNEPDADSSQAVISVDDPHRMRFMIGAHVFLRGPAPVGRRWVNPALSLGVDVENPLSNAYFGISVPIRDVAWVTVGAHAGRVTRLPDELQGRFEDNPGGQLYAGDSVPTVERLVVRGFASVGIGLQSATAIAGDVLGKLLKR